MIDAFRLEAERGRAKIRADVSNRRHSLSRACKEQGAFRIY
jgi:hypothetical protein